MGRIKVWKPDLVRADMGRMRRLDEKLSVGLDWLEAEETRMAEAGKKFAKNQLIH